MRDVFLIVSIPQAFAALLQGVWPGVRIYANRAAKITLAVAKEDSPLVRTAVDLAVHVYRQLGFVLGILLSSVTCVAYGAIGSRPSVALVALGVLLGMGVIWLIYWQGLTAKQLEGKEGRWMSTFGWAATLIQWALSLYAAAAAVAR